MNVKVGHALSSYEQMFNSFSLLIDELFTNKNNNDKQTVGLNKRGRSK